jgi:hypothetical protein
MTWPTPALMRKLAHGPGQSPDVRDIHPAIADNLERQGWHELSPDASGAILVTEAKWREIEADAAQSLAEEPEIPGWKCYFEGKVFVHLGKLVPIIAMEPTGREFATKQESVAAALVAIQATGGEWRPAADLLVEEIQAAERAEVRP